MLEETQKTRKHYHLNLPSLQARYFLSSTVIQNSKCETIFRPVSDYELLPINDIIFEDITKVVQDMRQS